jgi:acyl-CoA thioesterase YciA
MREVVFHAPVYVGDIVSFYTRTVALGRTSVTVRVEVEVQRQLDLTSIVAVTGAEVVYVAIDAQGHPTPIRRPEAPSA